MKKFLKLLIILKLNFFSLNKVSLFSSIPFFILKSKNFKYNTIYKSTLYLSSLGSNCNIKNAHVYGNVHISNFVSITGPGTVINCQVGTISIGSFCSIGQNVVIVDFNHDFNQISTSSLLLNRLSNSNSFISKGNVIIQEDVWIGSNSVILSGVTIGRGSIIGAGSIVTKSVEPYSIVSGNPAKKIKMRFNPLIIEKLERSKWWENSLPEINAFFRKFNTWKI